MTGWLASVSRRWRRLVEGPVGPSDDVLPGTRTRRMVATGSVSSLTQVVALLTSFVITPLLVRHLGGVHFGVYTTITSLVGWLGLAGIGMGPSLLNVLATPAVLRSRERAAGAVSSAALVQLAIGATLVVLTLLSGWLVPWADILNAPSGLASQATAATIVMFVAYALPVPLAVAGTVFESHQRGYVPQWWLLASHLVRLVVVWGVVVAGGALVAVVIAMTVPTLLAQLGQYVHAFRATFRDLRPRAALASWSEGRRMLSVAGDFLLLGVAAEVIMGTDNIVLAQVAGPAAVTPYAVTMRVAQLPTIFLLLALNAAWPAYREAVSSDVPWLRRTHRRMTLLGPGLALASAAVLVAVGRPAIAWWAGPDAVPSPALLAWLVAIPVVQSVLLPRERLLIGLGATRLNAIAGVLNAALNLPFSILLARRFGAPGVAMGTVLGYLTVGWIILVASRRQLAQLEDPTSSTSPGSEGGG